MGLETSNWLKHLVKEVEEGNVGGHLEKIISGVPCMWLSVHLFFRLMILILVLNLQRYCVLSVD